MLGNGIIGRFVRQWNTREVLSGKFVAVFRDNGMKEELDVANGNTVVKQKLEEMQTRMFKNAQKELNDHVKVVMEWRNFVANLDNKNIIVAPFCLETACEDRIKKDSQRYVGCQSSLESYSSPSYGIPV